MMLNKILPHKEITPRALFNFEKTPFNFVMAFVTIALLSAFVFGFINYLLHGITPMVLPKSIRGDC